MDDLLMPGLSEQYISKADHIRAQDEAIGIIDKLEAAYLLRVQDVRRKYARKLRRRDEELTFLQERLTACQLRPSVYNLVPIMGQPVDYILKDDHERAREYACATISRMLESHATEIRQLEMKHEKSRATCVSVIDGFEQRLRDQREYFQNLLAKEMEVNASLRRDLSRLVPQRRHERPLTAGASSWSVSSIATPSPRRESFSVAQGAGRGSRAIRPRNKSRGRGSAYRSARGGVRYLRNTAEARFLQHVQSAMTTRLPSSLNMASEEERPSQDTKDDAPPLPDTERPCPLPAGSEEASCASNDAVVDPSTEIANVDAEKAPEDGEPSAAAIRAVSENDDGSQTIRSPRVSAPVRPRTVSPRLLFPSVNETDQQSSQAQSVVSPQSADLTTFTLSEASQQQRLETGSGEHTSNAAAPEHEDNVRQVQ